MKEDVDDKDLRSEPMMSLTWEVRGVVVMFMMLFVIVERCVGCVRVLDMGGSESPQS